jgi:hypothetical protein
LQAIYAGAERAGTDPNVYFPFFEEINARLVLAVKGGDLEPLADQLRADDWEDRVHVLAVNKCSGLDQFDNGIELCFRQDGLKFKNLAFAN